MNQVSNEMVKVNPDDLKQFVSELAQKAGMPQLKADFLAALLVKNDLRGVFSHGSVQMATYSRIMRDGSINPDPDIRVANESDATVLIDGDGGLGYFAACKAAEVLVDRCRATGIAAAVTRNHGHIGAAGIYSRFLAEHDLIGYVTSGHQLSLQPEDSIMAAAGGSPMSFAVPSGSEVPMVLDFGAMHDLYEQSPHVPELFRLAPGLVFRSMGLGFMCQALGGFLAGVPLDPKRAVCEYPGAGQGSLIIALDIRRFGPLEAFKSEMDAYMRMTGQMRPMPGYDEAALPGVIEMRRQQQWSVEGIPFSLENKKRLEAAAAEFGLECSF